MRLNSNRARIILYFNEYVLSEKWATPTFLYVRNYLYLKWSGEMKKEFLLAFNEVLNDRQLPQEVITEAIEAAMVSAYRKTMKSSNAQIIEARLNFVDGSALIFAEKEVVDEVLSPNTEVSLEEAKKQDPDVELFDIIMIESTPTDFGRVAAQNARQVIQQRIREAERQSQYEYFKEHEGEVISGIVQSFNPNKVTLGLDRKAEGEMLRKDQIPGERFKMHDRIRVLLQEVKMTPRGPQIILSRAHRDFLRRLIEDEVPEIYQGLVEIRAISREPGYRSKIAVSALQQGIDPVGACVGLRGVRIQAIVRELNDEKIDVIEWNAEPDIFISKAISPARVNGVYLDESNEIKTATVVVPEDQLSLAIGASGQNARLAARLTSWRIDIKSLPEATASGLNKLAHKKEYAKQAEELAEMIPQIEEILAKKEENRPISPEEYNLLARFVDQVEKGASARRKIAQEAKQKRINEIRESIPTIAYETPLEDLGISVRISNLISGEGYSTVGELKEELLLAPSKILRIQDITEEILVEIKETIEKFSFPEPVVEEIVEEVIEEVVEETIELSKVEAVEKIAEEVVETVEKDIEEVIASIEESLVQEGVEGIDKPTVEISLEEFNQGEKEINIDELLAQENKKKVNKKKYREIEYDPDNDVTIVKRRRKRKGDWDIDEWNDNWEY